jgi:hypothetical protein
MCRTQRSRNFVRITNQCRPVCVIFPQRELLTDDFRDNALIELCKSISVLGKWSKNRLVGQVGNRCKPLPAVTGSLGRNPGELLSGRTDFIPRPYSSSTIR